mgnify:CR=1 FL=1
MCVYFVYLFNNQKDMSTKGTHTTADYLNFDTATNTANKLMKEDKTRIMGLYIIISINTGLRIGDTLTLTYEQLQGDTLESKTNKRRVIALNEAIKNAISKYGHGKSGLIFISQKGSVFTRQQINRNLKTAFARESKTLNISSHTLRKTFGRQVFFTNNESEKALVYLSELMNHQNQVVTRRYLGLRQEELNNIYLNL